MERSLSRAGAVGNGKTDDTNAIQAAISEIERNTRFETDGSNTPFLGIGELVWPQGLFIVSGSILIQRSLRLLGEGQAEYSSGARIEQQRPGHDLFRVEPIAQGCSFGLNNLVLRANGGGGSGGALLRIVKTKGQCNSIRILDTVFATPQTHAIDITHGDDILIDRCLFDVSAQECIRIGQGATGGRVSNVRITRNNFYAIASECIVLGGARSVVIESNNAFTDRATRTFVRIGDDAGQNQTITIRGNTLKTVDCAVDATTVTGLVVEGNNGEAIGGGVAPRRAAVTLAGACTGVVVVGNHFSGQGTLGLYNDAAARVTDAVIVANGFIAQSAQGAALNVANTSGRIGDNQVSGAPRPAVGHRWSTSRNAAAPGVIEAYGSRTISLPVAGALPRDHAAVDPDRPLPDAIAVAARAKDHAIDVRYANATPRPVPVPPHDLTVLVTR
ncbi:right-handed parallel beta-helix repeat-containing protein [Sphingomonas sp. BT-65]|uniref:right-handed parallel beta-helix repeat-containing protein n=1 Tax=Sphingomonas sp. BT-65 TaxID=2989821 RepID=UPI002235B28D|nr:right-handed parallel beta-helix repeat-containing protein [Sphingomonas sp. BT-65]MCW4463464.1 right-handed parallel beta-helix repeat-containing protein [Sphingomonas sp. BT-65]